MGCAKIQKTNCKIVITQTIMTDFSEPIGNKIGMRQFD